MTNETNGQNSRMQPNEQLSAEELEFRRHWRLLIDRLGGQIQAAHTMAWPVSTVLRDCQNLPTTHRLREISIHLALGENDRTELGALLREAREARRIRRTRATLNSEAAHRGSTSPISNAINNYWTERRDPLSNQPGNRHAISGPLDSILKSLITVFKEHGIDDSWITIGRQAKLPGSYRQDGSLWDIAIIKDGIPLGAINISAHSGSIGKNFTNRINDATARSISVRTVYDSPELSSLCPCLGVIYLVEETSELYKAARITRTTGTEHAVLRDRIEEDFHVLTREGFYDAASLIISTSSPNSLRIECHPDAKIANFVRTFMDRVLSLSDACEKQGITPVTLHRMIDRRRESGPNSPQARKNEPQTPENEISSSSDASDKGLIFRVYIPSNQLYSSELDYFLSLFRSWMTDIRGYRIRQDGYETPTGKVCEFHLANDTAIDINQERLKFANFLDACEKDPSSAASQLSQNGIAHEQAFRFALEYGQQAQSLNQAIRHAREDLILKLQHNIQSDLASSGEDFRMSMNQVSSFLNTLIPDLGHHAYHGMLDSFKSPQEGKIEINISQRIIGSVHGNVIDSVNGTANFGTPAKELLALINENGGSQTDSLKNDLFEFEDEDAPLDRRRRAKNRLRSFVTQAGSITKTVAIDVIEKYIEAKAGL